MQPGVLVGADQQEARRLRPRGLQRAHGVERVAGPGALELAAVEQVARLAGDGQSQHGLAMRGGAERARLLPGLAGGDPAQLVERQGSQRLARQRQVGVVHRVEAATEEADALGTHAGRSAQSRGRRKSV